MVQHNVVHVLHVEWRHARSCQVAGTETDMTDDDVGLCQFHLVAGNADTTARCRLTGYGHVGVIHGQLRRQIDGAAGAEQDGAWRVVACTQGPAQRALHQCIVRTVVRACHVIHLGPSVVCHASACGIFAIALGTGEGDEVCTVVVHHGKHGLDGHIRIQREGVLCAG